MIEVECHISIKRNGHCFLDPLKIELLNEIIQCGSLNSAARKIGMSYQHVWTLIDVMNKTAFAPLIIKKKGGVNGGGAEISSYGKKILKEYKTIEKQVNNLITLINVEINL
jgi:molybdate transport system regulatory protein